MICSDHSALIVDAIIGSLRETEVGLANLYQAMAGVKNSFRFKPLDKVYVPHGYLPTYRMDKDAMIREGLIIKDYVPAMITEVNPFKRNCYTIRYKLIDKTGTQVEDDWTIPEMHVEKDPNDVLLGEDLPF